MNEPAAMTAQMNLPGDGGEQTFAPLTTPESAAANGLYELVAQQPFFQGLNREQLQLLTDSAMVMQFGAGEEILREGGPANRFYLILEGNVSFEMGVDPHGEKIVVQIFGAGEDLGWSWLFPPYILHYSARAITPTRMIFFYGIRVREQCEQDHQFGYQLMKRVAAVAVQCLQDTQQRLVSKITGVE